MPSLGFPKEQSYKATQPGASRTPPPPAETTQPLTSSTQSSAAPSIDPSFIRRCQQELAELIGPIASIVCQRTLAQNPKLSPTQFVEALAKKIPNSKQAQEFQRRLL